MYFPAVPQFKVTQSVSFIILDGWERIRKHSGFLGLVWAIFNIPTNLFLYFRLEPYMNRVDIATGGQGVFFAMILLKILGYIPMIAMAVLIRNDGEEEAPEDYNELLMESVKRIPLFVTTSVTMMISMFFPAVILMIPVSLLSIPLSSFGISEQFLMILYVVYFIVVLSFLILRYYPAGMFYLMLDISNFRAVAYSTAFFKKNRKTLLQLLGLCFLLPMLLSYGAVFLMENSFRYMLVSLILEGAIFLGTGIHANLFRHIELESSLENRSNNAQDDMDKEG